MQLVTPAGMWRNALQPLNTVVRFRFQPCSLCPGWVGLQPPSLIGLNTQSEPMEGPVAVPPKRGSLYSTHDVHTSAWVLLNPMRCALSRTSDSGPCALSSKAGSSQRWEASFNRGGAISCRRNVLHFFEFAYCISHFLGIFCINRTSGLPFSNAGT